MEVCFYTAIFIILLPKFQWCNQFWFLQRGLSPHYGLRVSVFYIELIKLFLSRLQLLFILLFITVGGSSILELSLFIVLLRSLMKFRVLIENQGFRRYIRIRSIVFQLFSL